MATNMTQAVQKTKMPEIVGKLLGQLPAWPATQAFVTAFNLTVWKKLRELDWDGIHGRKFCVVIKDLQLALHFSVTQKGLRAEKPVQPDVIFTASLMDFIRLALRLEDPDTLFFNRRLLIEGNTDVGLRVKNMLDGVEFETLLDSFPGPLGRVVMYARKKLQQT
ncbi:MAG: O2-independent ubiquinone biosynthesis accessory factor UbiT [Pseudomonadota bacterium]|nr:O2-independent ubiquinone biosynthesis accessory factor UbiT [Pseudomonadota bacterium]